LAPIHDSLRKVIKSVTAKHAKQNKLLPENVSVSKSPEKIKHGKKSNRETRNSESKKTGNRDRDIFTSSGERSISNSTSSKKLSFTPVSPLEDEDESQGHKKK
jgi:hypothetical protein